MSLVELLPFAAIAAAFWLLIIRPSSVRRKAQAALVASLAPGQRIMTTAGVFGTVVAIDADRVSVEVAPGVVIEMLAQAVAQVVPGDPSPNGTTPGLFASDSPEPETSREADVDVDDPPTLPTLTPEADRG
ncbi:MAG TPA: preprotein translocase subunit YajC [Candidatus Limnocylindrales bacterium]|nr:preprotein translocase subunit YajC [Candidatus Limnocylindrales bacterium]